MDTGPADTCKSRPNYVRPKVYNVSRISDRKRHGRSKRIDRPLGLGFARGCWLPPVFFFFGRHRPRTVAC